MIRSSIKFKFAAGSIGIIFLLGIAVIAIVRGGVARHLRHEMTEKGVVLSEHFAHMAVDPVLTDNYVSLQMLVNDYLNEDIDIEYVIVIDRDGRVIAHTFGETFPADLIEANVLGPGRQFSTENLVTEHGAIIDIAVPILKGSAGVARLGFSERNIKASLSRVSRSLLITVLLVMGAGSLLSLMLGNAITRPIVDLKRMAEAVGEGNLELKAKVTSNDEAGHLAASFNLMTDKLKNTRDELEYALIGLEDYSRNLEDKVKQRTADLMVAKEELEQEVKERKETEEKLRLTQFTVDSATDPIFWVKSDARFVYVNEAACNSLGYSREELLSMRVHDINPNFQAAKWPDHWERMRRIKAKTLESVHRTKDGREFPVELTVNHIDHGGEEYHCTYARDLTERKLAEKETVRAAQLASVGELAAGVAFEINDPLNGIINYAEILASRVQEEKQKEIVDRIITEGDRISRVVSSLLSFTRMDDEAALPVKVGELISEVMDLVSSQLAKYGIEVDVRFSPDLPHIMINYQHIEQVFLNVISNARDAINGKKYSDFEKKSLGIEGKSVEIDGKSYVQVSFTDNGTGMPANIIARAMYPFFTTKGRKGTGLGLSVSHSIVNDHGGKLEIESEEGKFTRVSIYLPAGRRRNSK